MEGDPLIRRLSPLVTFLFCTKTICLGSDHKAKPKGGHFSAEERYTFHISQRQRKEDQ